MLEPPVPIRLARQRTCDRAKTYVASNPSHCVGQRKQHSLRGMAAFPGSHIRLCRLRYSVTTVPNFFLLRDVVGLAVTIFGVLRSDMRFWVPDIADCGSDFCLFSLTIFPAPEYQGGTGQKLPYMLYDMARGTCARCDTECPRGCFRLVLFISPSGLAENQKGGFAWRSAVFFSNACVERLSGMKERRKEQGREVKVKVKVKSCGRPRSSPSASQGAAFIAALTAEGSRGGY